MDRLDFQNDLWETDPTAAISLEQLELQYVAGKMYASDLPKYMLSVFGIQLPEFAE